MAEILTNTFKQGVVLFEYTISFRSDCSMRCLY